MNADARWGTYDNWRVVIQSDFGRNAFQLRAFSPPNEENPRERPAVKFAVGESFDLGPGKREEVIWLPPEVIFALQDALGDPDNRYQRRVRELEADLKRAYEHMAILASAVAGRIPNEVMS